jgi:trehalose 6-phosphate phosphatase
MSDHDASTHLSDDIAVALEKVAGTERLLVALDFDGTLAPLTDEPMSARALPESATAVRDLAAAPGTVVAFVSGRTLADLAVILEYEPGSPVHLAGSHGAEFQHPEGFVAAAAGREARSSARHEDSAAAEVLAPREDPHAEDAADAEAVRAAAERAVEHVEGAWIEHKAFGFGLHTRLSSPADAAAAAAAVDDIVARHAPSWRRRSGRDILEFAWRHEGKDSAVAQLREQTGATAVVFAGDDVTDEDALASLGEADLGIRVGEGDTAATIRVADAKELAGVLSALARLRIAARS